MGLMQEIRARARYVIGPVLGICAVGYFAFHVVHGDRGLIAWWNIKQRGAAVKVALAVTTNLNINFYRKPAPGKLRAEARILKMGARLAVGDVLLYSEGVDQSVAHVTITYSIPTQ